MHRCFDHVREKIKVVVAIGFVCITLLVSRPSSARADVVNLSIAGELSDGGEFFGTFGID